VERVTRLIVLLVLMAVGLSAVLSIRAHYMVWKYSPPRERLPRPNS
jgi:hypothetical protein